MQVVLWTAALLGTLLAGSGVADGQQYIFRETVRFSHHAIRSAASRSGGLFVKVQAMTTIALAMSAVPGSIA